MATLSPELTGRLKDARPGERVEHREADTPDGWYLRPGQPSEYELLSAFIMRPDGKPKTGKSPALKAARERLEVLDDSDARGSKDERIVCLPADHINKVYYEGKRFRYLGPTTRPRPTIAQAYAMVVARNGREVDEARQALEELQAELEQEAPPVEEKPSPPSAGVRKGKAT